MYSLVKLASKYIVYFLSASNGKGHGVHSPFVFGFIQNVLNDTRHFYSYDSIEGIRKKMIADDAVLTIEDFGAGSTVAKGSQRKVSSIARSALKPAKFGRLMFRIVNHYSSANIIELGTSLGITTAYLASPNGASQVTTLEGAGEVARVAQQNFDELGLTNIKMIQGNFDDTLKEVVAQTNSIDLAFVDGNHRKEPTIQYFEQLLLKANENSIFIFDDIHWSSEMEQAWLFIKSHPSVTLTIDLFFIGLVFFRKEQKKVQHFSIRF